MPEEIKITAQQLEGYFNAVKDSLSQEQKDMWGSMLIEVDTLKKEQGINAKKADIDTIQKKLDEIAGQAAKMMNDMQANQGAFDTFVAEQKKRKTTSEDRDGFDDSWTKMINDELVPKTKGKNLDSGEIGVGRGNTSFKFELKTILTTSNAITGGGTISYNPRQGLLPTPNIHMRDLLPTVLSNNGSFVTYQETNSAQSAGVQTEGSAKTALNYAFTATTKTLKYIAGMSSFSKQLLFNLNFLQGTLPRMLMRDFFRKEDDYLYTTIAGNATGNNAAANPTPTVDIEEIVRMIANQRNANYNADIGIVDWTELARISITKPNDYSLPAGTVVNDQGTTKVWGMPIIGASWAQTDHLLLWDRDYVERVEGESLRVEFSYENQDNFEKNLVTARVECFEEVNLLRADAIIYRDFGNS